MWARRVDVPNVVRNILRRGYLLATYNDGKMLRARVKTGVDIENDKIDVMHPVGFVSHVKAGPKVEVITADIGGDSSRRVVLAVVGDREQIPQAEEGEAFFYTPGDKSKYVRFKTNGAAARAGGRGAGLEFQCGDLPISMNTSKSMSLNAKEGINFQMDNQTFEGKVHIKGDLTVDGNVTIGGNLTVGGTVTAANIPAG